MGASFTVTSRVERKITWTCAGRSTGVSVPLNGITENMSHTSRGQSGVGSNVKLEGTESTINHHSLDNIYNLLLNCLHLSFLVLVSLLADYTPFIEYKYTLESPNGRVLNVVLYTHRILRGFFCTYLENRSVNILKKINFRIL